MHTATTGQENGVATQWLVPYRLRCFRLKINPTPQWCPVSKQLKHGSQPAHTYLIIRLKFKNVLGKARENNHG